MKNLAVFAALSSVALAVPSPQAKSKNNAPLLKAKVLKTLPARYKTNATRAVYMYGPFKLPPSTAKHGGTAINGNGIKLDPNSDIIGGSFEAPCKDCTVHRAMANFAYQDGRQADVADGVYIHHMIVLDYGGKVQLIPPLAPPKCANGVKISPLPTGMMGMGGPKRDNGTAMPAGGGHSHMMHKRQLFGMGTFFLGGGGSVGSGNPFSPKPEDASIMTSGYWIGPGGRMSLNSEVVNYDPVEKDLYLTLDVEWTPGKDSNMMDVGMGALTADRCDAKEQAILQPPKDRPITYTGDAWFVSGQEGYFINFTPHLHDGGVKIKVYINNKEVCESHALYGSEGGTTKAADGKTWQTITGYSGCEKPIKFAKGDKVHMSGDYDLTKYRLRPDSAHSEGEAEGMVLATFIFARPFAAKSSSALSGLLSGLSGLWQ